MKLKTFTVSGIPAGECYIAFEAGYVGVDDIYGFKVAPVADYDFVSEKLELANTATVNYEYIASLKFGNAGTKNIAENTFTANFIVNGSVVDSKSVPALERDSQNRNTSASVSFNWTPREVEVFLLQLKLQTVLIPIRKSRSLRLAVSKPWDMLLLAILLELIQVLRLLQIIRCRILNLFIRRI